MTKLNWNRAKKQKPDVVGAADRWFAQQFDKMERAHAKPRKIKKTAAQIVFDRLGPPKQGTQADRDGIWIVSHATGNRVVHHFKTLAEARHAGFDWAV